MANIKVRDLADTSSITLDNQIMVLTNDERNQVQNITVENLISNITSSSENNGITTGPDGKLYVDNAPTGVEAGTYEYVKNLVVNNKGQITSIEQGQEASVPIANTQTAGIVKPDGVTITATEDGTISTNTYGFEVGDTIFRLLPSTDGNKHLLDGALIQGEGINAAFVNYIANLHNNVMPQYSNVAIIGGTVDTDGVLSGFSGNNWAQINRVVPYSTANTIDIQLKITTGTLDTTNYKCFYSPIDMNSKGVNIQITPDNLLMLFVSSNNGISWDIVDGLTGVTSVQSNTTYYLRYTFDGSSHKLYSSTTGAFASEEILEVSVNNSTRPSNSSVSLGVQAWAETKPNYYFRGSIDLNESYINIDGQRWWSGRQTAGFLPEAEWQESITQYGVCGKFVYDSINNTVRLPKVTGIVEGTLDANALGDLIKAGLPNITGNFGVYYQSSTVDGAFSITSSTNINRFPSGNGEGFRHSINFDASRDSAIYKNNFNKVQPQTIKGYFYIVIATAAKTDTQLNIDNIATDLYGKADTDLSNCTKPYITESYVNGTNGYNIYSNGYCEQWGRFDRGIDAGSGVLSIPLLVPYTDKNYIAMATTSGNNTSSGLSAFCIIIHNSNATYSIRAYVYVVEQSCRYINWYTKGYIR